MQKKDDLFSKLNIKDYNNKLEGILDKKSFTSNTKNILLNVLYKMETSYDDYKKVKVRVNTKKELIENIIKTIKNNCKEIEIVRPKRNGETKLKDNKYLIDINKGKIISYPNENNIYYALNELANNKFVINDNYYILKESMEELLNQGYTFDKEELVRDFDGWTWNINYDEIKNFTYNLIYQNLNILLGNDYLEYCLDNSKTIDILNKIETRINSFLPKGKKTELVNRIYKVSVLESIKDNLKKQIYFAKQIEEYKELLRKMGRKRDYLQNLANNKKIITKEIKSIDESISNNKMLRESFVEVNNRLSEDKKVFSLSEYVDILRVRRNRLYKQLEECSFMMKPENYIKRKNDIQKVYDLLKSINIKDDIQEELYNEIIELQKDFLRLFNENYKKIEYKKEVLEYIYLFRYYKLLYLDNKKQIKDNDKLKHELEKTEKHLITRACKLRVLNILSQDIEENYRLVSEILSYNIIELEDVKLEFKKLDKHIVVTIYDDETVVDSIIYDGNEELNVKYNRRMKLFN